MHYFIIKICVFWFFHSEKVQLTTPNKYEFHYIKKPDSVKNTFNFEVKAANNVHVALSRDSQDNSDMYEIVLGGWSNTLSWISLGKEGNL